jgi:hypothetical protein
MTSKAKTKRKDPMKSSRTLPTALALGLCALGLTVGNSMGADKPRLSQEAGTIKSVDATKHELVVLDSANKQQHSYTWNDSTRFQENGKTIAAAQLKTGEIVHLSYQAGGGRPVLHEVTIAPPPSVAQTPKKSK